MTEENRVAPTPDVSPKSGVPTWIKLLLGVSLALNLAIAGTVVGFAVRGGKDGSFGRPPVRELSFGPFSDALTRDQRRQLLRGFMEKGPRGHEIGDQIRQEYFGIVSALKQVPFDPAQLNEAVAAQSQKMTERLDLGRQALVDLISGMSPDERAAFIDRLEHALSRGKNDRK